MSRMKSLAWSLMWWPGMDHEMKASPSSALHPRKWPTCPWARLHVDFAGPMDGRMYLIVVDVRLHHMYFIDVTCVK